MSRERFFSYLGRVNAVAFAFLFLGFVFMAFETDSTLLWQSEYSDDTDYRELAKADRKNFPLPGRRSIHPTGRYYRIEESNGNLAVVPWPKENKSVIAAIRMGDGTVIDRATVTLPVSRENSLSAGLRLPLDDMRGNAPAGVPRNRFGEF